MTAYYNEYEPFAAAWLRELIADGLIAKGDVDERSILDVPADDLRGYRQVHFFAGIGGWSRALRLAGWPDDREVWTGSCPCQPLSSAGQQKGHEDERHIWPAFYGLIAECRPTTVFGEQVGSKLGLEWLAGVRADLESRGYACGAADLPAAGVGAPHIRQRLWWVGHADSERQPAEVAGVRQGLRQPITGGGAASRVADNIGERSYAAKSVTGTSERLHGSTVTADEGSGMADAKNERRSFGQNAERKGPKDQQEQRLGVWREFGGHGEDSGMADASDEKKRGVRPNDGIPDGQASTAVRAIQDGGMADADGGRSDGWRKPDERRLQTLQGSGSGDSSGPSSGLGNAEGERFNWSGSDESEQLQRPSTITRAGRTGHQWGTDFWDGEYIPCADGKARRTQPGIFPLAHGIPNRVGTLRGAGNAIVPQVASVFITAFMESKK